jgi:hypothetical protein
MSLSQRSRRRARDGIVWPIIHGPNPSALRAVGQPAAVQIRSRRICRLRRQDARANIGAADGPKGEAQDGPNNPEDSSTLTFAPKTQSVCFDALYRCVTSAGIIGPIHGPNPSALRAAGPAFGCPNSLPANLSNRRVRPHFPLRQKRKRPQGGPFAFLAEREGFEPSVGYSPTPDFESGTFDHSATSPVGRMVAHASWE